MGQIAIDVKNNGVFLGLVSFEQLSLIPVVLLQEELKNMKKVTFILGFLLQ